MTPFFSHGGECLTDLRPKKGDHPLDLGFAWAASAFLMVAIPVFIVWLVDLWTQPVGIGWLFRRIH